MGLGLSAQGFGFGPRGVGSGTSRVFGLGLMDMLLPPAREDSRRCLLVFDFIVMRLGWPFSGGCRVVSQFPVECLDEQFPCFCTNPVLGCEGRQGEIASCNASNFALLRRWVLRFASHGL